MTRLRNKFRSLESILTYPALIACVAFSITVGLGVRCGRRLLCIALAGPAQETALHSAHDRVVLPRADKRANRDRMSATYARLPLMFEAKGLSRNNRSTLARAPGGQMQGAATQAMSMHIVEERQRSRCPPAAAPLRAAARRPAGFVARSLHTAESMLVARASPAGLGASSKVGLLFRDRP
jgi:hypothetical protein